MSEKTLQAVEYMRSGYGCAPAVMCAFHDDAGISIDKAKKIAPSYCGGAKIKCGALCAAEFVLQAKYPNSDELCAEFENKFRDKVGAINCREIRSQRLRPCIGCVEDSATILENMLAIH